jgi:hypothetical protein
MPAKRDMRHSFEDFYLVVTDKPDSTVRGNPGDSSKKILADSSYNEFKTYMVDIQRGKQRPNIKHHAALSAIEVPVDGTLSRFCVFLVSA